MCSYLIIMIVCVHLLTIAVMHYIHYKKLYTALYFCFLVHFYIFVTKEIILSKGIKRINIKLSEN